MLPEASHVRSPTITIIGTATIVLLLLLLLCPDWQGSVTMSDQSGGAGGGKSGKSRWRGLGLVTSGSAGAPGSPSFTAPATDPAEPSSDSLDISIDDAAPTKYDENLFLIGGRTTGPGDMERVDFKIHEIYKAWARKIVESQKFPGWKGRLDISTIARVGFIIVLRWLDKLEPEATERSVYHRIAQMEEVLAWEMRSIRYVKFIDQMQEVIQEQLALPNGRMQVARMLRKLTRHIAAMEEGFYKAHFQKMFNERFGAYEWAGIALLEGVTGVEYVSGAEVEQMIGAEEQQRDRDDSTIVDLGSDQMISEIDSELDEIFRESIDEPRT